MVRVTAQGNTWDAGQVNIVDPAVSANLSGIAGALNNFFDNLNRDFLQYLLAVAALGVLTMAIIEALKNLTPVRRWYHRGRLDRWIREGITEAKQNLGISHNLTLSKVRCDLVAIAADNDEMALYDGDGKDFCANVTAVAHLTVDYPQVYPHLLAVFASAARREDYELLIESNCPSPELADARNRIRQQVAQALNALQLSLLARWTFGIQIFSFLLSLALACVAMILRNKGWAYSEVAISALFAAFLAPVAKDLAAGLQKLRA
jgi:hypothetical protein